MKSEGWAVVPKSDAEAIERNNAKLFEYITPARVDTETLKGLSPCSPVGMVQSRKVSDIFRRCA